MGFRVYLWGVSAGSGAFGALEAGLDSGAILRGSGGFGASGFKGPRSRAPWANFRVFGVRKFQGSRETWGHFGVQCLQGYLGFMDWQKKVLRKHFDDGSSDSKLSPKLYPQDPEP